MKNSLEGLNNIWQKKESANLKLGRSRSLGLRKEDETMRKTDRAERPAGHSELCPHTHTMGPRWGGEGERSRRIYKRIMAETFPNLFVMLVVMIYYNKKLQMKVSKGKRSREPRFSQQRCVAVCVTFRQPGKLTWALLYWVFIECPYGWPYVFSPQPLQSSNWYNTTQNPHDDAHGWHKLSGMVGGPQVLKDFPIMQHISRTSGLPPCHWPGPFLPVACAGFGQPKPVELTLYCTPSQLSFVIEESAQMWPPPSGFCQPTIPSYPPSFPIILPWKHPQI